LKYERSEDFKASFKNDFAFAFDSFDKFFKKCHFECVVKGNRWLSAVRRQFTKEKNENSRQLKIINMIYL
jgi:hypothetical protein